jgi:ABC-type phosphate transport system auxiliary subunit
VLLLEICLCLLLTLYALIAQAAEPRDTLEQLEEIRRLSQASLSDFYLLYGADQDPALANTLQQRVRAVNALFGALQQTPEQDLHTALEQLEALWHSYAQPLQQLSGDLQQQISLSPPVFLALLNAHLQLIEHCDQLTQQRMACTPRALQQELSLQLRNLSLQYIAYSVGANALGGEGISIDQLTRDFSTQLQALTANNEKNRLIVASIQRKWRFIEAPLLHYNGRTTVPFLVNKYTARIIELLTQLQTSEKVLI